MSTLTHKDFQPKYFELYGATSACTNCNDDCFGIGGTWLHKAQDGDTFSAQFDIGLSDGETQLMTNPEFTTGSDSLDGWTVTELSGAITPTVSDNTLSIATFAGIKQCSFTPNSNYLVVINVVGIIGTMVINGVEISEAGLHEIVVTADSLGCIGINPNQVYLANIEYFEAYDWADVADFTGELYLIGENPTTATPTHTFDASVFDVSDTYLSINFNWDDLGVNYGKYFVSISYDNGGDTDYMVSNPIDFQQQHCDSFLFYGCLGVDSFGFYENAFFPSERLYGRFTNTYDSDRLVYRDTGGGIKNYFSDIRKTKTFSVEAIPEFLQDWIGTWLGYQSIDVLNQSYVVEGDDIDADSVSEAPTWATMEIELRRNNLALRREICDEYPACVPPPPNCWLWEDGQEIDWEDDIGECILYN